MVARHPTKSRKPFPPVPRRVTIHAVFDGGHAAKVDAEGTGDPPAMAITNWLHGAALSVVRRVARWFDV